MIQTWMALVGMFPAALGAASPTVLPEASLEASAQPVQPTAVIQRMSEVLPDQSTEIWESLQKELLAIKQSV